MTPSRLSLAHVALAVAASIVGLHAQDVRLVHGSFDPTAGSLPVAAALQAAADTNLWIVQFAGAPTDAGRNAVRALGAEIHGYLPDHAYVVRADAETIAAVRELGAIRAVTSYHPAYRLEPALRAALGGLGEREQGPIALAKGRYNVVVVDKRNDKPGLIQKIRGIGGKIVHEQQGSILLEVELSADQLQKAARFDEVLWIDRWTPPGTDMDNARIQGGGNYVESQGGFTGTGLNAHIYEGIDANHPAFSGPVVTVNSGGASTGHGTNTAGIVFGDGTGNPAYRGMAPDVGKFYTNYSSVTTSRWQVFSDLVNVHDVSHTTASWGDARTTQYTSISADADDIIFDHDLAWTQSQSNAGNQQSRPQAWAKNVFSIGGVGHGDNADPSDDSWAAGGGSTGPAADGRIKPTLCAYYDDIGTTSQGGGYTSGFGGTSGATPIVAGHNVLAIQMFTDGIFGNTLRNPGGSRHSNRPHFTTLKALQVANAAQYTFTASSTDNRREHCGWGFPDLRRMWDTRNHTLIVDETDVLGQGQSTTYNYTVAANQTELKVAMSYSDPAANPSANPTRINDLSLRVTSPTGTVYWGNQGLEQGNWSTPGGTEDSLNTTECVFVANPTAGTWTIEVMATLVVQDSHVETPAVDADYGLVASYSNRVAPVAGNFTTFGSGCPGSVPLPPICASLNASGGTLASSATNLEYAYPVSITGSSTVVAFELFTQSTGGTVNAAAALYADVGGAPSTTPLATTTMSVGPTPGFYQASFATPVPVTGNFFIALNHANAERSTLSSGSPSIGFYRNNGGGTWAQSGVIRFPSYIVTCAGAGTAFAEPLLTEGSGRPTTGANYGVALEQANPNAIALSVYGFSNTAWSGGSLPTPVPGAPGCDLLVSPESYDVVTTDGSGNASYTLAVPNVPALINLQVFHQWVVADPGVNSLGVALSNGGIATIGNL